MVLVLGFWVLRYRKSEFLFFGKVVTGKLVLKIENLSDEVRRRSGQLISRESKSVNLGRLARHIPIFALNRVIHVRIMSHGLGRFRDFGISSSFVNHAIGRGDSMILTSDVSQVETLY